MDRNSHAQLVCDWVGVFGNVAVTPDLPSVWPDVIVVDSASLRKGKFAVLVATTPTVTGRKVVRIEAVATADAAAWATFFSALAGAPSYIVCDRGGDIKKGIRQAFPRTAGNTPQVRHCEWHLRRNLLKSLPAAIRDNDEHPIRVMLEHCFDSLDTWDRYLQALESEPAATAALKSARSMDKLLRLHIPARPDGVPRSNAAAESVIKEIRRRIGTRATLYSNRNRTNIMLAMWASDLNGTANHTTWLTRIRNHLTTGNGHAPGQRQLADPAGKPSL